MGVFGKILNAILNTKKCGVNIKFWYKLHIVGLTILFDSHRIFELSNFKNLIQQTFKCRFDPSTKQGVFLWEPEKYYPFWED